MTNRHLNILTTGNQLTSASTAAIAATGDECQHARREKRKEDDYTLVVEDNMHIHYGIINQKGKQHKQQEERTNKASKPQTHKRKIRVKYRIQSLVVDTAASMEMP